jgi:hypothetical protein
MRVLTSPILLNLIFIGIIVSFNIKIRRMKSKSFVLMFFLIFLTLIVVSCKKEPSTMIGRWNVLTHKYTVYQNDVASSEDIYNYNAGEFILVINADGTGNFTEYGYAGVTFTWAKISDTKYSIVESPDPTTTRTGVLEVVVGKNTLVWTSTFVLNAFKFQDDMYCSRI